MVGISRKKYEKNDAKAVIDNDGILWLNEKHIEEGSDHKKSREIAIKCIVENIYMK